ERRASPRPDERSLRATGCRPAVAVSALLLWQAAGVGPPRHDGLRESGMTSPDRTDAVIVGSGFGGAIAAYHLAAGGARVVVLERGPWLEGKDFDHDYKLGASYTRVFDFVVGDGMSVLGGNCVGGGSVVYFAAMPRAPR